MLKYMYPEGKFKALTFSYDDAEVGDRQLVAMFDKYGFKGTFHLNSGKLDTGNYISASEVKSLYEGHEVACHGVMHKHPLTMSRSEAFLEYSRDREMLEKLTGKMVRGLSYAYGEYGDETIEVARSCGLVYSRTVEDTFGFRVPADFMKWHPTIHHGNGRLFELIDDFLAQPDYAELPLMYIWGHSFEFDRNDDWGTMDKIGDMLSGQSDIWYAPNIEIYEYITAVRALVYKSDGSEVYNPSAVTIWFKDADRLIKLSAGECYKL